VKSCSILTCTACINEACLIYSPPRHPCSSSFDIQSLVRTPQLQPFGIRDATLGIGLPGTPSFAVSFKHTKATSTVMSLRHKCASLMRFEHMLSVLTLSQSLKTLTRSQSWINPGAGIMPWRTGDKPSKYPPFKSKDWFVSLLHFPICHDLSSCHL
jgi:hypothetical protein